jgi:hypothetical protein
MHTRIDEENSTTQPPSFLLHTSIQPASIESIESNRIKNTANTHRHSCTLRSLPLFLPKQAYTPTHTHTRTSSLLLSKQPCTHTQSINQSMTLTLKRHRKVPQRTKMHAFRRHTCMYQDEHTIRRTIVPQNRTKKIWNDDSFITSTCILAYMYTYIHSYETPNFLHHSSTTHPPLIHHHIRAQNTKTAKNSQQQQNPSQNRKTSTT